MICLLLRYIFYMNYGTTLERKNLINGHVNEFPTKFGDAIAYHDLVNKLLYFHQKSNDGKDMVYSIDYDGNFLKNIMLNGSNVPAIAVFNDFLYKQRIGEKTINEVILSTGAFSRKIILPKPFFQLTDIAVIDTSLYRTGNHVD